jgi:hypothetical protein
LDRFPFRSQGRGKRAGAPPAARPQPARVARDLALALRIQGEIDAEGLTFREVAPRHGCSRQRVCNLLRLTSLAPDIQQAVSRMTTETASEALDRRSLEWVAETMDWTEQRDRFQKVMTRATRVEPAPIARQLAKALRIKKEVDEKGMTLEHAVAAFGFKAETIRRLLELTRLAPDIQRAVLGMTMETACWYVTEPKLHFIAAEPTHAERRRLYEKLVAGQLRSTRRPRGWPGRGRPARARARAEGVTP